MRASSSLPWVPAFAGTSGTGARASRPPEKIALAKLHAAVAQDVVGRGGVEIEVRQRKGDEIVRAFQCHRLLRADREGDVFGCARVDLRRREAFDIVDRLGD